MVVVTIIGIAIGVILSLIISFIIYYFSLRKKVKYWIHRKRNPEVYKIGATSGLNKKETEIQNYIINIAYQEFKSNPVCQPRWKKNYIPIEKKDSFEEEKFNEIWLITIEEFFHNGKPKVRLIKRAEEITGNRIFDDSLQNKILQILKDKYTNQPKSPYIKREKLLKQLGSYNETEIDANIWFLKETGKIKTRSWTGARNRGYSQVKIQM